MKTLSLYLATLSLIFISCKDENKEKEMEESADVEVVETVDKEKRITFVLESRSGSTATGKVSFAEMDGKVSMEASLSGLEPGTHAIHIHEKADCSAADATSSGGHWNPTFENHGKWGDEEGFHRGDIGNFEADDAGNGSIRLTTDLWCLGCDDENKNVLGKAIVVHQGADDFTSQPSGAAGARVSCGGIIE